MNLPLEILMEIAPYLSLPDLQSFRLAHRRFAVAGLSAIARHVSTLNTSSCLKQLQQLLKNCKILASSARRLTISHGEWPVCPRGEWETHHLLFGGNDRWNAIQADKTRADKAFHEYTQFITEEAARTFIQDVDMIFCLLNLAPNLQTIVISHTKALSWHPSGSTKYQDLQQKIWMTPFINDQIAPALEAFLVASSNKFPSITCLKIDGTLNPADLYRCSQNLQLPYIRTLYITSLQIQENEDVIRRFLQAFPKLRDLSLGFKGWESSIPNIVGGLSWPDLKKVRLDELWASEEEIFGLFNRHQQTLEQFRLGNTTIIRGNWRSLFTQIRGLHSHAHVAVDGELYGRRRRDTVTVDQAGAARLTNFMQNPSVPWPFGSF